jgi:hypothetical protein
MGLRDKESDVLRACLQWLTLKGVFHWRQNQGAIPLPGGKQGYRKFVGMKGVSDILGVLPLRVETQGKTMIYGVLLAVEVKREGEKLRIEQEEFLRRVEEAGGIGVCVHSVAELERAMEPWLG